MQSIPMPSTAGLLRERLKAQKPTFWMAVRACPMPELVHFAASTGHHGVYLDMQHGAMDVGTVAQLCLVAQAIGLPTLVRIPELNAAVIGNVLDHGATGILVPDVEDSAMAEAAVEAAYHAPTGRRSMGGRRGFSVDSAPYVAVMIESARGVESAGPIACTTGIDAVVVGLVDLAASLGDTPLGPSTFNAVNQILAAGKTANKPVIVAGLRDAQTCQGMVQRGAAPCFMTGTDISYLFQGAEVQIARFRALFVSSDRQTVSITA